MFVKFIKEISLKKKLKNSLKNVNPSVLEGFVVTIGLIIDETYFVEKDKLIAEIESKGIERNNIQFLIYKEKVKKSDSSDGVFSNKDVNWVGDFSSKKVTDFLNSKFDLLISYYDIEKIPLLLATHKSKALFKVGFTSVDKRLNHLMINANVENYKVFVLELFKYLKILNKI